MVTTQQVVNGIVNFADAEIIPKLAGVKRYGAAVYLALVANNAQKMLPEILGSPAIKVLGVCDESGGIDLDKLHGAMTQAMRDDRLTIDVPMLGAFAFTRDDIDRLYEAIRRA